MEALLSLSFDNLSSYDQTKIRKGLRQIEGLLAQICLSSSPKQSAAEKRRSVIDPGKEPPPKKALNELGNDPAFREFFKLQDGFEWNVALRLVNCLDRLLGKMNDGQNDLLIIQTLNLIQGILLLHPPSRSLFSREIYMNVRTHFYYLHTSNICNCLLTLHQTAPTRPPRTSQLPSHSIRNHHNPRLRTHRHSPKHTNIREPRWPAHYHLIIQIARDESRGQAQIGGVPLLLPHARNTLHPLRERNDVRPSNHPTQSK
jgi:hypothetical protein